MSALIQYEAWLLGLSLITGAWLMLAYDTLRVFRLMIPHGPVWMGIEDFFYWMYAGVVTFMLLYEQNNGGLRAFVIVGVLAGMILYDRIISRFFFKGLKKLSKKFTIKLQKNVQKETGRKQAEEVGD